ncbi:unnamed protein product [Victoria cruziana]
MKRSPLPAEEWAPSLRPAPLTEGGEVQRSRLGESQRQVKSTSFGASKPSFPRLASPALPPRFPFPNTSFLSLFLSGASSLSQNFAFLAAEPSSGVGAGH